METGEIQHIYKGRAPGNGAALATAATWSSGRPRPEVQGLRRGNGQGALGIDAWRPVDNSTITYAVNGKQYIAVMSGEGLLSGGLITQSGIQPARRHNEIYVFALPDQR
jgi:hypothetical protein